MEKRNSELVTKQKSQETQLKTVHSKIKVTNEMLTTVCEMIDREMGPFQQRFENTTAALKVQCQVYHSGALVGGDIYKVFGTESWKELSKVLKPMTV